MNNQFTNNNEVVQENVLAGIVGAFLFSLAGGVLWFVLYMVGFMASISGLVAAICAIKGYSIFAKKESTQGIIISVVVALVVMVIAWYCGLAYDIVVAYDYWYEIGDIDYTINFFDAVRNAHLFLFDPEIGVSYFVDLGITILLCAIGAGSYVVNKVKNAKAQAEQAAAAASFQVAVPADEGETAEKAEDTETTENAEPTEPTQATENNTDAQ